MKKIIITPKSFKNAGKDAIEMLKSLGYDLHLNQTGKTYTEQEMIDLCADAHGLIVGIDPVTQKVLASPTLKAVSKYGAGLDNIDLEAAKVLGTDVKNAAGSNATSVAELAIGLCFALARSIVPSAISTRNGGWERALGTQLTGKTCAVLGLGNIGRETCRMANGLSMRVLGYDPYVKSLEGVELVDFDTAVKNADFISIHMPLLPETKQIINKTVFSTLKPNVLIVNTSRGEVVDEDDLYTALKTGQIAGYAGDVFSKEPPEPDDRFLALDNFILTAHIGAFTAEANKKMADLSAQNLVDMLEKA